jgi:hypothetical protein
MYNTIPYLCLVEKAKGELPEYGVPPGSHSLNERSVKHVQKKIEQSRQWRDACAGVFSSDAGEPYPKKRRVSNDVDSTEADECMQDVSETMQRYKAKGIAPRCGSMSDMSKSTKDNAISVGTSAVNSLLKVVFPSDLPAEVLGQIMLKNEKLFGTPSVPSTDKDMLQEEEKWAASAMVRNVKAAVEREQEQSPNRKALLSLLVEAVPTTWVERLFKTSTIGKDSIRNAKVNCLIEGSGAFPPSSSIKHSRNKRQDDECEAFFVSYVTTSDYVVPHTVNSGRRDRGNQQTVMYRKSCPSRGYELYREAAKRDGKRFYSRTHWFERDEVRCLKDAKTMGGLCQVCDRYHTSIFITLLQCAAFIYTPEPLKEFKTKLRALEMYFEKGGAFQSSISYTGTTCVHHCATYACSDPLDPDFAQECGTACNGHPDVDPKCIEIEELIFQLKNDAVSFIQNKTYKVFFQGREGRVKATKGGKVTVEWDSETAGEGREQSADGEAAEGDADERSFRRCGTCAPPSVDFGGTLSLSSCF